MLLAPPLATQKSKVGDLGWTGNPAWGRQLEGFVLEPVLEKKVEIVALIKHLATHVGVELPQAAYLAVLLCDQPLIHRGDLNVHFLIGQVEVWREEFRGLVVLVEFNRKRRRFVLPVDPVKVE